MRSNYRLSEQLIGEISEHLNEQNQGKIKPLLSLIKAELRSVVIIDMNCHPRLLFIYSQFFKLKEMLEQHNFRKEQFLFPFLRELVYSGEPGHLANAMVVNSFLSVFGAENDKIAAMLRSLEEASSHFHTTKNTPEELKKSFGDLSELSAILTSTIEKENAIFLKVKKSHKEQINFKEKGHDLVQ